MTGFVFDLGYTRYAVSVTPNKSITIEREGHCPIRFGIGDPAEYDSYNLKYTGTITNITEKTVTIQPKYENKKRRLKLQDFAWRNYDFNSEKIAAENFETMLYI